MPTPPSSRVPTFLLLAVLVAGIGGAVFVAVKKSQSATPQKGVGAPDATPATAAQVKTGSTNASWTPPVATERQTDRDAMIATLRNTYHLEDGAVLDVMAKIPRHAFVPDDYVKDAYSDSPLPIPNGQLISQPYIVADMTSLLHLKPNARVLEIGTGSGYQAAVLSYFTQNVYSIEIIRPLAEAAASRLKKLGYDPVQLRIGDGFNGWPEAGPFDAIIVTCAAGQIPPPLIKQLANGGRMLIPVGAPFAQQSLMLVEKDAGGSVHSEELEPVRFVPLLDKDPSENAK